MKRAFDIFFSLLVIICFSPFAVIISLIVGLSSRGGVFYSQQRIGKNGFKFRLLKFRTMQSGADKSGKLTVGMNDSRITKIGSFLRRSKLDEFPQFVNVLLGDMSVVGPRPEVEEYVKLYTDEQRKILSVRPGITDYASLEFFRENELLGKSENPEKTYLNEIMPAKIKLNFKYLESPSLAKDFSIIWRTFKRIVFGR